jgi:hypothetical protein
MNYYEDDYVMGHLLRRAREIGASTLEVDLLSGLALPAKLCEGPVSEAIEIYASWFPELVRSHDSDLSLVESAQMTVEFDLDVKRPNESFPDLLESPFTCIVAIRDDRGKQWRAELSGWWFPEPRGSHRADRLRRSLARVFGFWKTEA